MLRYGYPWRNASLRNRNHEHFCRVAVLLQRCYSSPCAVHIYQPHISVHDKHPRLDPYSSTCSLLTSPLYIVLTFIHPRQCPARYILSVPRATYLSQHITSPVLARYEKSSLYGETDGNDKSEFSSRPSNILSVVRTPI
jgi:hypothetical protein